MSRPRQNLSYRPGPSGARRVLALALGLCLMLGLAACAGKGPTAPPAPAAELWKTFAQRRAEAAADLAGLKATASLHYADLTRKNRVTLTLWGSPDLPLRLDLFAGFGSTFAMIREGDDRWQGYLPEKETLYIGRDARSGQNALGFTLPFSLKELAAVVTGSYGGLVPQDFEAASLAEDGGWTYAFSGNGPVTSMTLDEAGRPVVFAGRLHGRDWTMTLSRHGEDAPAAPGKISIHSSPETTAVLRIKTLERLTTPWPEAALALTPPPGTMITSLDP